MEMVVKVGATTRVDEAERTVPKQSNPRQAVGDPGLYMHLELAYRLQIDIYFSINFDKIEGSWHTLMTG